MLSLEDKVELHIIILLSKSLASLISKYYFPRGCLAFPQEVLHRSSGFLGQSLGCTFDGRYLHGQCSRYQFDLSNRHCSLKTGLWQGLCYYTLKLDSPCNGGRSGWTMCLPSSAMMKFYIMACLKKRHNNIMIRYRWVKLNWHFGSTFKFCWNINLASLISYFN